MHSQISQILTNQPSKTHLATTGGADPTRKGRGSEKDGETFQTVMDDAAPQKNVRGHTDDASRSDLSDERPVDQDAEQRAGVDAENGESDSYSADNPNEALNTDPDTDPTTDADILEFNDVDDAALYIVARDAENGMSDPSTALPQDAPDSTHPSGVVSLSTSANTAPPWFVASEHINGHAKIAGAEFSATKSSTAPNEVLQQGGPQGARMLLDGVGQAKLDAAKTPKEKTIDSAALSAQAVSSSTSQPSAAFAANVKQDTAPPSFGMNTMKSVRDEAASKGMPDRVAERAADMDLPASTFFKSQRPTPMPMAIGNTFSAPAFSGMGLPENAQALENSAKVRWVSDMSFSADVALQDMPATSRAQQMALLQQPDLPRHVAVQLAHALRQGGLERPMELVLSPAELGRVRISMQAGDGAMVVQVVAERPETLDLMRRNIDQLAQEFRNMGFDSADFSFGHNAPGDDARADGENNSDDAMHRDAADTVEIAEVSTATTRTVIPSDRVDLRL